MKPELKSSTYANISMQYMSRQGEYKDDLDTAMRYAQLAMDIAREHKYPHLIQLAANYIARTALEAKNIPLALAMVPEADRASQISIYQSIGVNYLFRLEKLKPDLDTAELMLRKAMQIRRELNKMEGDDFGYYYLANVEIYRKTHSRLPPVSPISRAA